MHPHATTLLAPAPGLLRELSRYLLEVVDTDALERDLTSGPVRVPAPAGGVNIVRTDEGDSDSAALTPAQQRHVRPFLRRGDTGLLAMRGDDTVGWIWLSRVSHRDPWSGLRIRLAPDEGYAYDLWTEPGLRYLLLGQALVGSLLAHAQGDLGLTRVYGWVDQRNRGSDVLLRMLGFSDAQSVQRVHVLHRVGWKRRGSDCPPYGPLSRHGRHTEHYEAVRRS
ncbi:MAG: Acetyltransferase family protein [Frankiales bacterium]|jgi:RimJ/RimL family protein N-acetyltransferase|nr:Acetyltransferase family protein [Frankiales bacterium]